MDACRTEPMAFVVGPLAAELRNDALRCTRHHERYKQILPV
jgi:hypothetical protein